MKFTYYYEETSQDTRSWEIESEVMLTEDEIMQLSTEVSFEDGDTSKGENYQVTFTGTEYGDDTQYEIDGDEIKEEDEDDN